MRRANPRLRTRRPRSGNPSDAGSASVEFLAAAILLLVPLVYLVVAVSLIQSAALGVEGAARQAARAYVRADSVPQAQRHLDAVLHVVAADHGLEHQRFMVEVACSPRPSRCLQPDGTVTVTLRYAVPLPFVPFLDGLAVAQLQAQATQPVSRFGGAR